MLLATIAYEAALYEASPKDSPDPLLPILPASPSSTRSSSPSLDFSTSPSASTSHLPHEYRYPPKPPSGSDQQTPFVIDLRWDSIYRRLRDPAPPAPERRQRDEVLPLPNTTAFQLSGTLQLILRARARAQRERLRAEEERRQRQRERRQGRRDGDRDETQRDNEESSRRTRTIPGALDMEEEGS